MSLTFVVLSSWNDSRIDHGGCSGMVSEEKIDKLWRPDLYFINANRLKIADYVTVRPEIMSAFGPHELKWAFETKIAVDCEMDFGDYPFDVHLCRVLVMSFRDNSKMQKYHASSIKATPIGIKKVLQYDISYEHLTEKDMKIFLEGDDRSVTGFGITMKRRILPILINTFLSTFMITSISVISFKIPPESVPGRLGLLVTAFLVLVNISASGQAGAVVGTNVFTSLDLWLMVCKFVVAAEIFEYAVLLRLMRVGFANAKVGQNGSRKVEMEERCTKIDARCFYGMIISYVTFTVMYFSVHLV